MESENAERWFTADAFITDRHGEVIKWIFTQLDALYYPLTNDLSMDAVDKYRYLIERACSVFRESPDPNLIWELRERAISELGEVVYVTQHYGTHTQRRYMTEQAYYCMSLLAHLPTGRNLYSF